MSNSFQTTGNDDLDAVIASFLQALERGDAPDRDDLIKERPQFEEELRAFFADLDGLPNVEGEEATEEFAAGNDSSRVIGNYELVQKIGSGGMGEVWVAKQSKPVKRRVALKLIKAGMDSKQVVSRFEVERQALAAIDHPNVAKVLDAGTTPLGQPFFVMELVNGAPLTKYCDEAKLSVQERLELMVQIASAVQHAHHKGIVHRDLKPANILVTVIDGKPVPKIIDFGLAKALGGRLTEESFATHFGSVMGTLEYMAPEQAGYSGQ
ncbi:MAG: serine/threonine protein kinase, partial [Planctomycetales bacterium]|nr:serine/threonine protein kinase [Planctomycetales bacterium]